MNYQEFLKSKVKTHQKSGFDIDESDLNKNLFPFQKYIVKKALKAGRYAIFADTGLGKTLMQLSWADAVLKKTNLPVLILAPLAVTEQTINEGLKFGIKVWRYSNPENTDVFDHYKKRIYIINYEQLINIDTSVFSGVVLDESSILKSIDGKTKNLIIHKFRQTNYKLACSATPSPNDHMELGNHSEFLNAMSYNEMLAMFFVHDGGETSKWRLRKHAEKDFWNYVLSWSIAVDNPKTLGFESIGYDLPQLNYIEHLIDVDSDGLDLFGEAIVSATELHRDLRKTLNERCKKALNIIQTKPNEQWIIWGLQNTETDLLNKIIDNSVNVQGSDKPEIKAKNLIGFANGDFQNLITKTKIASFGMNYQNSCNMIFVSYDFKFEAFYQAVRRSYRFGQKRPVNVHVIIPKSQMNVRKSILEKEKKHKEMIHNLAVKSANYEQSKKNNIQMEDIKTDNYWLMNGDCVQKTKEIPDNSIDYIFFSPPFSALYVFSDSPNDLSNVKDDNEFFNHFRFLIPELLRVLKNGRLVSIHIMQGTTSIGKDGFYSIKDYRGEFIREMQKCGFYFHAEKMIRKDPQLAAIRTKNHQLMHGSIKKDSSIARPGLADYIITFRKSGKNEVPIKNDIPFDLWCKLAEPVWMDIDESDIIKNFREGRTNLDERHLTPTQRTTIRNCYLLWSNEGDTIFCPFAGIGTEGYEAIKMNRKSVSIELKKSYFLVNKINHLAAVAKSKELTLF